MVADYFSPRLVMTQGIGMFNNPMAKYARMQCANPRLYELPVDNGKIINGLRKGPSVIDLSCYSLTGLVGIKKVPS